ncbi:MAG: hypothetical protein JNL70_06960 [Saprospiraceae bacterium]|nr:hypothetical protein [Saprospiraceae bacterium]
MTTKLKITLTILSFVALVACKNNATKPEATTNAPVVAADTTKPAMSAEPDKASVKENVMTLNAMFVEFTLGDAEHYTFKDKAGKTWNFGGCTDESVKFGEELPESKANSSNQGWTSNKKLQKKWFDLKYVVRKQPLYIDGPEGDVLVITEAKMVQ